MQSRSSWWIARLRSNSDGHGFRRLRQAFYGPSRTNTSVDIQDLRTRGGGENFGPVAPRMFWNECVRFSSMGDVIIHFRSLDGHQEPQSFREEPVCAVPAWVDRRAGDEFGQDHEQTGQVDVHAHFCEVIIPTLAETDVFPCWVARTALSLYRCIRGLCTCSQV